MKKIVYLLLAIVLFAACGKRQKQQETVVEENTDIVVTHRPEIDSLELPVVTDTLPAKKEVKRDTTKVKKTSHKSSGGGGGGKRFAFMNDENFKWSNQALDSTIFPRIQGRSWRADCPLDKEDFAYIQFSHHNFHGGVSTGEMIVSRKLSNEVIQIFYELYQAGYPIERVRLVDDYGANDEASMTANNTSSFNYREVTNAAAGGRLSKHALGRAIDINPLYNPYVKKLADGSTQVLPHAGTAYADRSDSIHNPYRIDEQDAAYRIFKRHGWRWGGDFRHAADYQHFEK